MTDSTPFSHSVYFSWLGGPWFVSSLNHWWYWVSIWSLQWVSVCLQPPSFCPSACVFLFRDLSPGFEPCALKVDCLLWFLRYFLLFAVVSAYLFAYGLLSHEAWACSCSAWVHLFPVGFTWPALYRKVNFQADPSEKSDYLVDYLLHQVMIEFDRLHNFEAFSTQFLSKHFIVPTHLIKILTLCMAS